MAWEGLEKRKFPRASKPCKVQLKKKEGVEIFSTRTENISCGGICVILPKDLGNYTSVDIELDLEDGQGAFNCAATVVWSVKRMDASEEKHGSYDTGIEFSNLKDGIKDKIAKFVKACSKEEQ